MKFPLTINCEGLSRKRTNELADDLSQFFSFVHNSGEIIVADGCYFKESCEDALQLLNHYGVKILVSEESP